MVKLLVGVERRMCTKYWLGLVLLSFPLFSAQLADAAPPSAYLNVPFLTQMGSAGDPNSGSNNCGPASVAMTINFYGGAISVSNAAIAIRGWNNTSNTTTDFMAGTSTGNNTVNLLAKYFLNEAPVNNYSDLQNQIAAGHPVIILINNNKYRYNSPPPYSNNNDGWFTTNHIVVVNGYDSNNVYINDPLRSTGAYPIPVSVFQSAASTTGYGPSWHATALVTLCTTPGGSKFFDDFSSDTPGQAPSGYLLRGASGAAPTVQEVGGTGPTYRLLSFPYVGGQYWDSWALESRLRLCSNYTVRVKLNFQTSGDRGGLTIAWNDTNWDRIDIQPNIFWQDVEFRISYTGPISSSPVVTGPGLTPGGLPWRVGTTYWLQVAATSNGPGQGKVIVSWSSDGVNFTPVVTATGLAEVTGLAGMGTAGPNLPKVYFDDFLAQEN